MYLRNGVYYTDFYDKEGKRQRVSLKTKDPQVAKQKEDALVILHTATSATIAPPAIQGPNIPLEIPIPAAKPIIIHTGITWKDFKAKYMPFLQAERKYGTVKHYKLAIKYLETFKSIGYLAEITPDLLQELKQWLVARKIGNAGVNKDIRCVKSMMRWAERKKMIASQDWLSVPKLRESRGRLVFYTEEEVKKLISVAHGVWKLVIRLGARAGLRRGEIVGLQWQDIDFNNNQIYIAPNKTDKHRYVPISEDLRTALQEYPKDAESPFIINLGKKSNNNRNSHCFLSSYYPKIRLKAGLGKKGSMHTLRHTFASHLVQNGVDLYLVSKLLGHSSIKMTEIYAHLATKTLQDAINKLPSV